MLKTLKYRLYTIYLKLEGKYPILRTSSMLRFDSLYAAALEEAEAVRHQQVDALKKFYKD